ncbi:MAG TPA: hypothetical protein VG939_12690 [Caulobacteraceae bacterium]|nr:hypothetical protein [Caulobacteraceae bacterium]
MRPALPLIAALILAAGPAAAGPWRLHVDGDGANLTNGDSSGEDAATSLQCQGGEGKVTVYLFLDHRVADHLKGSDWVDKAGHPAPWKTPVLVVSGAVAGDFAGEVNADEMNGGSSVEVVIPAASPVMAAFAKTGAIRFSAYGEAVKDAPIPAAKAAGLMRVCRKGGGPR